MHEVQRADIHIPEGEASMTDAQFLVLAACIWLTPHASKQYAQIGGCVMLIVAAALELGWKP
jgi:hypothetical protein